MRYLGYILLLTLPLAVLFYLRKLRPRLNRKKMLKRQMERVERHYKTSVEYERQGNTGQANLYKELAEDAHDVYLTMTEKPSR